jgi:hypothetical protein
MTPELFQADGRIDMTKIAAAFHNFAKSALKLDFLLPPFEMGTTKPVASTGFIFYCGHGRTDCFYIQLWQQRKLRRFYTLTNVTSAHAIKECGKLEI